MASERERHEPQIYVTGRHGAWAWCSCGWTSGGRSDGANASVAWSQHVRDEASTVHPDE